MLHLLLKYFGDFNCRHLCAFVVALACFFQCFTGQRFFEYRILKLWNLGATISHNGYRPDDRGYGLEPVSMLFLLFVIRGSTDLFFDELVF